jgi:hypothetical protein
MNERTNEQTKHTEERTNELTNRQWIEGTNEQNEM